MNIYDQRTIQKSEAHDGSDFLSLFSGSLSWRNAFLIQTKAALRSLTVGSENSPRRDFRPGQG